MENFTNCAVPDSLKTQQTTKQIYLKTHDYVYVCLFSVGEK